MLVTSSRQRPRVLANILQYTRPLLQPKIISPEISIVPEVEKLWQDSGSVSKCLVRAEREPWWHFY